jgi:hypothetical protein
MRHLCRTMLWTGIGACDGSGGARLSAAAASGYVVARGCTSAPQRTRRGTSYRWPDFGTESGLIIGELGVISRHGPTWQSRRNGQQRHIPRLPPSGRIGTAIDPFLYLALVTRGETSRLPSASLRAADAQALRTGRSALGARSRGRSSAYGSRATTVPPSFGELFWMCREPGRNRRTEAALNVR